MNPVLQVWAVLKKELLVEFRKPARASGVFFFALAILLMVAFASPTEAALPRQAGGTLWVGLLLASTRSLDQSYGVELEEGALEGMTLWPVDPRAIFYGKALANALILIGVAFAILPLLIAIYNAPVKGDVLQLFGFLIAGCFALAGPGTLYGLMAAKARGSSVLLPLLMFPFIVPALVSTATGTSLLFEGDPMGQASRWFQLVLAWDVMAWSLMGVFYGRLIED